MATLSQKKKIVLLQPCEVTPRCITEIKSRTAFLGKTLAANGHEVIWIKSSFNHTKKQFENIEKHFSLGQNFNIRHVKGIGYKKNVCIRRYVHDYITAEQSLREIKKLSNIDCIVSSIPSVHASCVVSKYAKKNNIPFILDLRDAWPDAIPYTVDNPLIKKLLKLAILPDHWKLSKAISNSSAIVSMSKDMLNWGLKKVKNCTDKPKGVFYLSTTDQVHLNEEQKTKYNEKYSRILKRKTFKVFYISQWGRLCQPSILVNLAAKCLKENVNLDFIICGDGDYGQEIRKKVKGLHNVFLPGFLLHEEAYFLAKMCNCGIVFISDEAQKHDQQIVSSFPNKVFFLLAAGLPILNGLSGEVADLIEKKNMGLNFKTNELHCILSKLKILHGDEKLARAMGESSQDFFNEHANPKSTYENYASFVEQIINSKQAS